MSPPISLERASRGWRAAAVAAFVAFLAGLPGLFAVPPLDRDESRFAQATAQMLETRDFVVIRFQDQPRFKKPVGIHWLQAASVSLTSAAEDRAIWAYRLPSLLGAMLAAAACAWGAAAFFGGPAGMIAGGVLGATLLLSTEAFIAKTDAVLCGLTTLALAALARHYAAAKGAAPSPGVVTRVLFWIGLAGGTLVKGPVGLMVVALTMLALFAVDRKAAWMRGLGWGWGLILFIAIVGPWAGAVTVATDGGFWSTAIAGDLAPKLAGGQETHGAPPGYHTLLAPILAFPSTLLIPAALALGWRRRNEPGVRFALCWLIPTWIAFEAAPTKLVHYTLPAYGALAWLIAAAALSPVRPLARWSGAALGLVVGLALAGGAAYLQKEYGDPSDLPATVLTAGLFAATGIAGAVLLIRQTPERALLVGGALGVAAHAALAAALIPRLEPLWVSREAAEAVAEARLLPRQGIAPAPVAVAGYAEPSLVFALGTPTGLGDAPEAAEAIADGRPAIVEAREARAFAGALKARGAAAREVARVTGLDYSNGDDVDLRIYAPAGR